MKALGILSVSSEIFLPVSSALGCTGTLPAPAGWALGEQWHADVVAADCFNRNT